jgi:predicted dehydrogenase
MIKVAIIGVSGFGGVHYRDIIRYQERGELQIVGAAIINQNEEAEKCSKLKSVGCELFTDYKAMLEKLKNSLDLCFIPTGISMHAPMAIAAMQAGANVFVEKPVTATLNEFEAIKKAEKESGKFVAVGYQTIYQPAIAKIKNAILDGKLGKINTIKFYGLSVRDKAYYSRNNWAGCIKNGKNWILDSPFNNAMAHQINLICFFAGKTFESSATLKTVQAELFKVNPNIQNADNAAIEMITDDNKKLLYYATHNAKDNPQPQLIISGSKGTVTWTFAKTICNIDGKECCSENNDNRDHVMDAVLNKIKGKESFICDLSIAGTQTLAMNAAHASSKIIEVPEDYVITQEYNNNTSEHLKGISKVMLTAFSEERLYSTNDYPWMKPGKVIDINNDNIEQLLKENTK